MAEENKQEVIIAFKGFGTDWKCRGYQFEVGKTYTHEGAVEICSSGFHACEYPLDSFSYYNPADSKYAAVEMVGPVARHNDDTKIASASITINAELKIPEIVSRAVDWIMARIDSTTKENNTGNQSAATNTGNRSAATNTGNRSAATNTGYQSAATNTGYQSAATNTGSRSAATNTGNRSAATNTGDWSAATVDGKQSVAIAIGYESKAKACATSAIVLCKRGDDGNIMHIRASKVGENGIKPDCWYSLDGNGDFKEQDT